MIPIKTLRMIISCRITHCNHRVNRAARVYDMCWNIVYSLSPFWPVKLYHLTGRYFLEKVRDPTIDVHRILQKVVSKIHLYDTYFQYNTACIYTYCLGIGGLFYFFFHSNAPVALRTTITSCYSLRTIRRYILLSYSRVRDDH